MTPVPSLNAARSALAALLAAVTAGCTVVPVGSLWALRKLDFAVVDPASIRLAVCLPKPLALPPEAVTLQLDVKHADTGESQATRLVLRQRDINAAAPAPPLAAAAGKSAGCDWSALALDTPSVEQVQQLQELSQHHRKGAKPSGAGRSSLEMSAKAQPCLRAGARMPESAPVSAWLYWAADPGWVQLLDAEPLSRLLPAGSTPTTLCTA